MNIAVTALVALCALTACAGGGAPGAPVKSSTAASPFVGATSPASGARTGPPPPLETFTTELNCGRPVAATSGLALYLLPTSPPMLEVLDVSNPFKPALLCTLAPAQGGRFDATHDHVVFWIGDQLGSADLTSGKVVQTARLPAPAFGGSFSRDGATFAYRAAVDAAGSTATHLNRGGYDRTLYTQEPLGGHGGPPVAQGPFNQLEFSPDGTELLDYDLFRPASGPDGFLVYRIAGILGTYAPPDSFLIFHSASAQSGVWSASGSTLYFFDRVQGSGGELDSLDAAGHRQTVAGTVNGVFWPRILFPGGGIVYDTFDSSGAPHLWRLDLTTHATSQLSTSISSERIVINAAIVWSNEEQRCECGPGGLSTPDGIILAHDLGTGREAQVDMSQTVPGIGGPPLPQPNTGRMLDVWF